MCGVLYVWCHTHTTQLVELLHHTLGPLLGFATHKPHTIMCGGCVRGQWACHCVLVCGWCVVGTLVRVVCVGGVCGCVWWAPPHTSTRPRLNCVWCKAKLAHATCQPHTKVSAQCVLHFEWSLSDLGINALPHTHHSKLDSTRGSMLMLVVS